MLDATFEIVFSLIVIFAMLIALHWRAGNLRDRLTELEERPDCPKFVESAPPRRIRFLVADKKNAFIIEQDSPSRFGDEDMRKRIADCFPNARILIVPPSAILTPLHPEIKAFMEANRPAPATKAKKNS